MSDPVIKDAAGVTVAVGNRVRGTFDGTPGTVIHLQSAELDDRPAVVVSWDDDPAGMWVLLAFQEGPHLDLVCDEIEVL